jgi:hypothetical protein
MPSELARLEHRESFTVDDEIVAIVEVNVNVDALDSRPFRPKDIHHRQERHVRVALRKILGVSVHDAPIFGVLEIDSR